MKGDMNPKDYFEQLKNFIEAGRNDSSRKIAHATYVVKSIDAFGETVYGIQYHRTVIFAVYEDGRYIINNGGYFTATTKKRINDALRSCGSGEQIVQRNKKWIAFGDQYDTTFMFLFDVNGDCLATNPVNCYVMPVDSVIDKNSKITNFHLSRY